MPIQNEFKKTQIIMTVLLLKDYFKNINDLKDFIESYRNDVQLLFTVPVNVNDYSLEQTCDFLDDITKQNFLPMMLPDRTWVQMYNGCLIKRTDLNKAFVQIESYSYKMRVDGEISHFYSISTEKISEIEDVNLRNELLSTHNSKERQLILNRYKGV